MGASDSKLRLPDYNQLAQSGIPSPHVPPPGFNPAFQDRYVDVLQHIYYGQRVDGIVKAREALAQTRDSFPLEHAVFVILRCLLDLHGIVKEAPPEIAARRWEGLPTLEGDIASVAEYLYHQGGEYIVTRARAEANKRAGIVEDPVRESWMPFFPKLLAVFDQCMPAPGQEGMLSDVQIFFHAFFHHYISNGIAYDFVDDANMALIKQHNDRQAITLLALCAQLRAQKRVDLELFLIKSFHIVSWMCVSPGGSAKKPKAVLKEFGLLAGSVTTAHQAALIRHMASILAVMPSNEKLIKTIHGSADALRACGDIYMETVVRTCVWRHELDLSPGRRAQGMRQNRKTAAQLQEWDLAGTLANTELLWLARTRWSSFEQCAAMVDAMDAATAAAAARLGPRFHSRDGSLSGLPSILWGFLENKEDYPLANRMVIAEYAYKLMMRYPPRLFYGRRLAEYVLGTNMNWCESWGVALDSYDHRTNAEKADPARQYIETHLGWEAASETTLFYEESLVGSGRGAPSWNGARRDLEKAEAVAREWFARHRDAGQWLEAVKHAAHGLGAQRYHLERPGAPIENGDLYRAARDASNRLPRGSAARSEAEGLLAEAKKQLELIGAKNKTWEPSQDRRFVEPANMDAYMRRTMIKVEEREIMGKVTIYIHQSFDRRRS